MGKQQGDWIQNRYQINGIFPFYEGFLYYTSMQQEDPGKKRTYFIHASAIEQEPTSVYLSRLVQRSTDYFVQVKEAFVEDKILYQVYQKIQGNMLGIYVIQYGPLSVGEVAFIVQQLTNCLMECYEDGRIMLLTPENIMMDEEGIPKILYSKIGHHSMVLDPEVKVSTELDDCLLLAKLIRFMLTKKLPQFQSLQMRVRDQRKDVPIELESLLLRASSPRKEQRPRIQEFWKWAFNYGARKPISLMKSKEDESDYLEVLAATRQKPVKKRFEKYISWDDVWLHKKMICVAVIVLICLVGLIAWFL